jgi:deoxycytidine triphosphate deaminase
MVEPFMPEKLESATYICDFSGTYLWYDGKGKEHYERDKDELIIKPNSITYLGISTKFRIPLYLILRFNLQVKNVYKGLLLGTGPIVDPGFEGNLFIPLHNLTSNFYVIKKEAEIISVEFTKLNIKDNWKIPKRSSLFKNFV